MLGMQVAPLRTAASSNMAAIGEDEDEEEREGENDKQRSAVGDEQEPKEGDGEGASKTGKRAVGIVLPEAPPLDALFKPTPRPQTAPNGRAGRASIFKSSPYQVDQRLQMQGGTTPRQDRKLSVQQITPSMMEAMRRSSVVKIIKDKPEITLRHDVLSVEQAEAIPMHLQGDVAMYTEDAVESRSELYKSKAIRREVMRWWNELHFSHRGYIDEEEYVTLCLHLAELLDVNETAESIRQSAHEDWKSDCRNGVRMFQREFYKAIFTLADMWTSSTEEADYVTPSWRACGRS